MIVYGADEFVSRWVSSKFPGHRGFGPCTAIGITRQDRMIAGLVWHDYRPQYGSIQMSIASEPKSRWCSRLVMEAFFHYPFVQLGCKSVFICVRRKAKKTRKFVEKVGFKFSGLLRRGFGTEDMVIYDMLQNECRWIRSDRERQPLAASSA